MRSCLITCYIFHSIMVILQKESRYHTVLIMLNLLPVYSYKLLVLLLVPQLVLEYDFTKIAAVRPVIILFDYATLLLLYKVWPSFHVFNKVFS